MFELKKASKPYIYVEILLLDYINSIGNSNKIISREIISNDESLGNSSTSVNENSIAEVDGGSDSVDKVNDEPNSIDDSINVDESVNEEKNISRLEITIHEGKNRQVRKMCEAVGSKVIALHRSKIGDIGVKDLKLGTWRYLKDFEVKRILM